MLIALFITALAIGQAAPQQKPVIAYEAFMELDAKDRRERFEKYDPETKSYLMRTHARKWLEKNRLHLSNTQIALMNETIDFLSPDAFSGTPEVQAKSQALIEKFKCVISDSDVVAALRPDMTPSSNWLNDLWEWFWNCAFR